MTPRERILAACNHQTPDKLPVDFGGCFQTGIHASVVYRLRQALGLDSPDTPVKVVEVYQMLGEIKDDLREALGIDAVSLAGTGTMFGYPARGFKQWRFHDGTPLLVPGGFNTEYEPNGDLLQYPGGDKTVPASGRMPAGGCFFDAIIRQPPIDDDHLDPADNLEEFTLISDEDLAHFARGAEELYEQTDRAIYCVFGGLSFGDIGAVPGTFLKRPKGIRDVAEWYMSLATRKPYIKSVFARQAEIAVENLRRLHGAVGDKIAVIHTSASDFGTQKGPFLSVASYREMFLPYQKKVNGWIHEHTPWKTGMHCCGGIWPLLDCIVEAEFDILNPVQCAAAGMEPKRLKREYGDRLVFWGGGVETQTVLSFGTPQQVRDQVRERIDVFSPGGGFVFSTIHNVTPSTPIENLLAMFDALREHR
jgi:hypothetical protein